LISSNNLILQGTPFSFKKLCLWFDRLYMYNHLSVQIKCLKWLRRLLCQLTLRCGAEKYFYMFKKNQRVIRLQMLKDIIRIMRTCLKNIVHICQVILINRYSVIYNKYLFNDRQTQFLAGWPLFLFLLQPLFPGLIYC
jgi:hypothetical protein